VCSVIPACDYSTNWLTNASTALIFNHMVNIQESRLDTVFHALGDLTRRRMLRSLAEGERTVGQLAEPFKMSLAAASKHIKALEGAGLVRREVRGRVHVCHLNAGPLSAADEWLRYYERFWSIRLDRLEELLRLDGSPTATDAESPPRPKRAASRGPSVKSPIRKKRSTK
jgi:DNA-binding transcriptional ArsR family regulator